VNDRKLILSYAKPASRLDLRLLIAAALLTVPGLFLLAALWMPSVTILPFDGPTRWRYGCFNYLEVIDPRFVPRPLQTWEINTVALALTIALTLADIAIVGWCWWKAFHWRSSGEPDA
jgi:hypothetical protein